MFAFAEEIDWVYMFCRNCWTYRRFLFEKKIPWTKNITISGECDTCHFEQRLNVAQATKYYEDLNKNNR